jgi:sigma-B regulation protein RsbU (phosphoserine phosphatase)
LTTETDAPTLPGTTVREAAMGSTEQLPPEGATAPGYEAQPDPVSWHRSLRTRLTVLSSLCSALLLLGVGLVIHASARDLLLDQSRGEIHDLAEQTARGMDAAMGAVVVSAVTLTESVRGTRFDPGELRALLRATAKGAPDAAGAMLILEPGALGAGDPEFSWYARREGGGYYEQSMRREGYDYRAQPWWRRAVREGKPWWSEPYRNEATGNEYFVTYNHPIRAVDGDGIVGMASVDVPLQRLRDLVGPAQRREAMFKVLLSPERLLAVHPDPQVELRARFDDLAGDPRMPGLGALLSPLREARAAEAEYADPVTGESRLAVLRPVGQTGWAVGLTVSNDYVVRKLQRATRNVIVFGLVATIISLIGLRLVANRVTKPIIGLAASARHFVAGEFDRPLPYTGRVDEVGVMARAFDHARGSIKGQLQSIEQMGAARQKLESELSIARDIQLAMLPHAPLLERDGHRLETHAILEPAKAVGGDFYTFLRRDDHTVLFALGDVSDKGVPAALFMARVITMLEVAAGMGGSPAHALRAAAQRLVEGNDTCMFATVLCGVADAMTGDVVLASAGHEGPVWRHADGRVEVVAMPTAGPLGIDVAREYPEWKARLQPGDALVAYTDGITEAFNTGGEAFGTDRLLAAIAGAGTAASLCESLVGAAHRFAAGAAQSDDITVLALSFSVTSQGGG